MHTYAYSYAYKIYNIHKKRPDVKLYGFKQSIWRFSKDLQSNLANPNTLVSIRFVGYTSYLEMGIRALNVCWWLNNKQ